MALLPVYSITGPHLISGTSLNSIVNWLKGPSSFITTADNGTTQTLTAAMVSNNGSMEVFHVSTGGSTPTLTLPTAALIIAGWLDSIVGSSYRLRIINNNSGTATIATGAGITLTGTATLATNTWREWVVTRNSLTTLTFVEVGTGTDS